MSGDGVNQSRRRFLTGATCVVGGAGVVGAAVPFLGSWNPSARAKAAGAPVKVNVSKLEPGAMMTAEWRGKPVYIVRRTPDILKRIDSIGTGELKDPESQNSKQPGYISGTARASKGREQILVLVGLCTHLGCAPLFRPQVGVDPATGAHSESWRGGFFCPCHGSRFDLSGRVFTGVPAPSNLEVPPYTFETNDIIVVGVDPEAA